MNLAALDFARGNRPPSAPGLIAVALGVGVLVGALQLLGALQERGQALDARDDAMAAQERQRETISKAHRNLEDPRARELMAMQRYATEPARHLIEHGWRPNLALLSAELATATREINLVFETRSAQEALSFADWLASQPNTERVVIKRQVEKPGPPVKSVETALQVIWRPYRGLPAGPAAEGGASASAPPAKGAP
ncbi:hypothetical protein [Cupriavidus plantarum]|uniref:hypothetical protein n=1 Tax=Cupriavidus plantarum TaxID=942865 RepID=UPI000E23BD0D|nr:hypothetical protein [Cupriavidus plantarum]NYI00743.1 hypothetical protein [Cupriavidus plantarum]REE93599.1 hypothetical protein C7418_2367 [Cupriavidus plantarum]